jgi:hypothetical protein
MVTALTFLLLMSADVGASDPIDASLKRQTYPWYDSPKEKLIPVAAYKLEAPEWLRRLFERLPRIPSWLGLALRYLLLAAMFAVLAWLIYWAVSRFLPDALPTRRTRVGGATSTHTRALPLGLDLNVGDLWAEAVRRRSMGDYSGATICLFAHQILALEKLKLIRLAPGRTARQLVRSVSDVGFRRPVESTLRMFEPVFYGHHAPSATDFEIVWNEAETLERRLVEGAGA